jgi:hypothetical protein
MGAPETFGGRQGLKRAGVEAMKRLKLDYSKELMASTAFIVVTGASRDGFSQLSSGEAFGCFSVDPEAFYKDLVSRINPSLYGRESARHLFNLVTNILEDKMNELDIQSYPMLMFNEKYNSAVNSAQDLLPLVRNAINDQVGSEIVGINAINSIVDNAIAKGHSATVTPVVLSTADEKFALDLQKNLKRVTSKVFLVVAGKASKVLHGAEGAISVKNVSEESVGEALTTIRGKILL